MQKKYFAILTATILLTSALTTFTVSTPNSAAATHKNFVVFLVDDLDYNSTQTMLGLNAPSCQGCANEPWLKNIENEIVNNGTAFNKAFASQGLCCPSRATYFTGQYPHNSGVTHNNPNPGINAFKNKHNQTIATWLNATGYQTAFIGKYLNGYGESGVAPPYNDPTYIPPGWDQWHGMPGKEHAFMYNYTINHNGDVRSYNYTHQTKKLGEIAKLLIDRNDSNFTDFNVANKFFIFISTFAPHYEHKDSGAKDCTLKYELQQDDKKFHDLRPPSIAGDNTWGDTNQYSNSSWLNSTLPNFTKPNSWNEGNVTDKGVWLQHKWSKLKDPNYDDPQGCWNDRIYKKRFLGMHVVDREVVGRVINELKQEGVFNDTVLIFASDNGWFMGEHRLNEKNRIHEESNHISFYIHAPGYIGNQTSSKLVLNNDLAPTILDLAGVPSPSGVTLDGRSLKPLLTNPNDPNWRKAILIESNTVDSNPSSETDAIRTETEVFAQVVDNSKEHYKLNTDPYQMNGLCTNTYNNSTGQWTGTTCTDPQADVLGPWLDVLKNCAGTGIYSCKELEDGPPSVKQGFFERCYGPSPQGCDVTVSGIGFKPKALIVFTSDMALGSTMWDPEYAMSMGFSDGTNQRSIAAVSKDNVNPSDSARLISETKIIQDISTTGIDWEAKVQSFNKDGFTVNWCCVTSGSGDTPDTQYIALGPGNGNITNVKVGTIISGTTTGNKAYTGLGFKPDFIMFMYNRNSDTSVVSSHAGFGLGFATSSSNRTSLMEVSEDNRSTSDTGRAQRTDRIIYQLFPGDTANVDAAADFVSFDTDGFTLNWTNLPNDLNDKFFYMAMKGGKYKVSKFDQKTSTGNQSMNGTGFKPTGLFLASFNRASSTVNEDHNRISLGAADGANEATIWSGDRDAVSGTYTASYYYWNVMTLLEEMENHDNSVRKAEADLQSFDSDGFTLNWTIADTYPRQIIYVAFRNK